MNSSFKLNFGKTISRMVLRDHLLYGA